MTATTPAKLIRLVREQNQGRQNGKHIGKRHKNVAWVDVSDDEDRPRKTPLKVIANGHHHDQARQPRNNKKARRSVDTDNQNINGAGPSNALLQEQRKQLPIAKGTPGWDYVTRF